MAGRSREIAGACASVALIALMVAGCAFLWVGVPLGWLWIGSQVQGSASLGTALIVTMLGVLITIAAVITILGWVNRHHVELQERRNRGRGGSTALEVILVSSAGVAVIGFGIWFFVFAGTSPLPLQIGF